MLEKLHAKHVLPGFADRSSEEREIDALTTDITRVRTAYPILSIPSPSTLFISVSPFSYTIFSDCPVYRTGKRISSLSLLFSFPTHQHTPSPRFFLSSLFLGLGYWCRPSTTPHTHARTLCVYLSLPLHIFLSFHSSIRAVFPIHPTRFGFQ